MAEMSDEEFIDLFRKSVHCNVGDDEILAWVLRTYGWNDLHQAYGWADHLINSERNHAMAEAARRRPTNYHKLPAAHQWQIDKELGILDWNQ